MFQASKTESQKAPNNKQDIYIIKLIFLYNLFIVRNIFSQNRH
jgi:hypothetical protein